MAATNFSPPICLPTSPDPDTFLARKKLTSICSPEVIQSGSTAHDQLVRPDGVIFGPAGKSTGLTKGMSIDKLFPELGPSHLSRALALDISPTRGNRS